MRPKRIQPNRRNLEKLAATYSRPPEWFTHWGRFPGGDGEDGAVDEALLSGIEYDEVVEAYRAAQPDLSEHAVRSIAEYIQFLHNRELAERR